MHLYNIKTTSISMDIPLFSLDTDWHRSLNNEVFHPISRRAYDREDVTC